MDCRGSGSSSSHRGATDPRCRTCHTRRLPAPVTTDPPPLRAAARRRSTPVPYDRDEWRSPWRLDPPAPTAEPTHAAPVTGPTGGTDPWTPAAPAPTATGPGEGDGRADDGEQPIARFPQPPPSSWSAGAAGPGSPVGSVRPPDTTGTVDAPAPAPAGRRSRPLLTAFVAGLVGAVVGASAVLLFDRDAGTTTIAQSGDGEVSRIEVDGDPSAVVPAVAQAVTPSVVVIDVPEAAVASPLGPGGPAIGSGVIYRADGYILTNAHVVGEADEVQVRLATGDVLAGEVVGTDPLNDLAVVRVEADGLPEITLRSSDDGLIVGETVVAIGSPFGLDASVTSGIISGLNRDLRVDEEEGVGLTIPSVIQTDAAINPGNSGGALVDARGRLIGINTAILTRTGGSQGVGFAVPAEQAVTSADQIIDQGFVRHPLLGISGIDVSPDVAEEFGLEASRGAVVDAVQEGTGAAEADLRPGDIIVEVDGEPLATMSQLVAEVRRRAPGDTVTLGIVRDGERSDVEVVLSERPRS
ncbi:PDZ domain-containing protein [Nitriliruptoraceae bacterium ZYF776]|nr:PDZ domain-containing protein [Profundirhabdus halotolerans]